MGKVDAHVPGHKKFPKEFKFHVVYLELDTSKSSMIWVNHAYLLPSYPGNWGLVRGKEISLLFWTSGEDHY